MLPLASPPRTSSVYGPVFSRRYGESLGVDLLLVDSICSFSCGYCQLGSINQATRLPGEWVPTPDFVADLEASDWRAADVITFSGSGEPTLATNLREAIREARRITRKPILVLTNASTLEDPEARRALCEADEVSCKLDATSDEWLRKINRPAAGITLASIVEGLRTFRAEFDRRLTLQIMVLPANASKIDEFVPLIRSIAPDEVFLNVPIRAVPRSWSVELRGDRQSGTESSPFRTIPADELEAIRQQIESATGIATRAFARREA
jgi:wyosine [tRNA(Phe)-imidazoG37] synthetase (radical SAM superfamily)